MVQHFFDASSDVNAFNVYVKYLAIKRHFTSDAYDFFKYNGKVNASIKSFQTRKDAHFFARIAKHPEPQMLLVCNLFQNPAMWVGDIADTRIGHANYIEWKKRVSVMTKNFHEDLEALAFDPFEKNFVPEQKGDYAPIIKKFLNGDISPETTAILIRITKTQSRILDLSQEKIILEKHLTKLAKYIPFLVEDHKPYVRIVKQKILQKSADSPCADAA